MSRTVCEHCDEPISDDDEVYQMNEDIHMHRECLLRCAVGSLGHQQERCSCYGQVDTSEDGLTRREAAKQAARYYAQQMMRSLIRHSAN